MKTWYVIKCEKLTNHVDSSAQYEIKNTEYSRTMFFPKENAQITVDNDFEDLGIDSFYVTYLKSPFHDFEIIRISSKYREVEVEDFNNVVNILNELNKPRKPGESIFANLTLY